jgi:hypothetical protein
MTDEQKVRATVKTVETVLDAYAREYVLPVSGASMAPTRSARLEFKRRVLQQLVHEYGFVEVGEVVKSETIQKKR